MFFATLEKPKRERKGSADLVTSVLARGLVRLESAELLPLLFEFFALLRVGQRRTRELLLDRMEPANQDRLILPPLGDGRVRDGLFGNRGGGVGSEGVGFCVGGGLGGGGLGLFLQKGGFAT